MDKGIIKNFIIVITITVLLLGLQTSVVKALEETQKQMHKMPEISPLVEFNQLKKLVGNWKGTQETPEGKREVVVEYHLTSAGTALVEQIFPGTEHEMMSVYHVDSDKVIMTYYCAFGNQPRMRMAKIGDSKTVKC